MATFNLVRRDGRKSRSQPALEGWVGTACSLLLLASSAFAQGGQERGATDFDELIRREELKSQPVSAPPVTQAPAPATDDLARTVQVELRRVGCDPGSPDGIWGPLSQQAAASFDQYGKVQYPTAVPTNELLQDLRGRSGRVCPAVSAPTRVVVPEIPPQPAPPVVPETSLAGEWRIGSDCPLDPGGEVVLTPTGRDQYRITGAGGLTGWVSHNRIHMEMQILINHVVWDGTIDSPTTMGGKQRPSLMLGAACNWQGRRK